MIPHAYLFVDGSCGSGEDWGGWAAVCATVSKRKILYGTAYPTTISRCELTPIIEGLRWMKRNWVHGGGFRVVVISDSEYTVKTLCKIYPRKKNLELWAALDEAAKDFQIKYIWRARNSLPYMTICDGICGAFRRTIKDAAAAKFKFQKTPEDELPYYPLPESMEDNVFADDLQMNDEDGE